MNPWIPTELPLTSVDWNWKHLASMAADANRKLAYYDGLLSYLVNPMLLLTPLERSEAVLSSKLEGTITTVGELLNFEAQIAPEDADKLADIQEVSNYRIAMQAAVKWIEQGFRVNSGLIRSIHKDLMQGVRGANKSPGEFRKEQNWIGRPGAGIEDASFIPPDPSYVEPLIQNLCNYIGQKHEEALIQVAIFHAQFEIIHPFLDGNGRTGRILLPLLFWQKHLIRRPVFYLSQYLEENRQEYYENLRHITAEGNWESWIAFFLRAVSSQAEQNQVKVHLIRTTYEKLRVELNRVVPSTSNQVILDFIFEKPIFSTLDFRNGTRLGRQNAYKILSTLKKSGIIRTHVQGSGRTPEVLRCDAIVSQLT